MPYTYTPVCCPASGLDFSCVDADMSVHLPAATASALSLSLAIGKVPQLLGGAVDHAFGLVLGAAFLHVADEPGQALLLLADVQPVDGLGETQVRVDARDDHAR